MLRSDSTALFERLRDANVLLQEVLAAANGNMSTIEQLLSTRVTEFVGTMNNLLERTGSTANHMDEHINSFYGLTTKVLGDLSELSGQFGQHGRSLAEAVELIDTSNRRTEEAVADRRTSLDQLLANLDIRTEDLDQRLKRFSGLLDDSLVAAEGRVRDIARVVAEASSTGARSIAEQHETIRTVSEQERARTADSLRGIYEQASGEAHALFRQTAGDSQKMLTDAQERFTDIMQGMKQMAAEMQRELDATRQELRRGILELPQETADSAAQMRRVIVDQIEALAELNRIVARHGRGLDTVGATSSVAAEPARRSQREEAVVVSMGSGRSEPRAAVATAPMPPPPPRREAPSLSPSQPAPGGPGKGGWLTDLLSRASQEEAPREDRVPRGDERPPRHAIESLDSLSVDIARMIDHDAAAELWDRYNRGERNVFTRRLYTMQGQKTFDEIRKRYRADREFKQTVDRYIGEFERLLEEVSRDDRGQVVARTYLTSETGKVYTMLAHAAGRFE
jgi:hypothetical protein